MSVTPNAMPAMLNDAVLPVRVEDYSGHYFDNTIGSRLGLDAAQIRWALDGSSLTKKFWIIQTEDNPRMRIL